VWLKKGILRFYDESEVNSHKLSGAVKNNAAMIKKCATAQEAEGAA
jgi:hypothetical protein